MGRPIEAQAYDHEIQRRGMPPSPPPLACVYSPCILARRLRSSVNLVVCLLKAHALWSINRRLVTSSAVVAMLSRRNAATRTDPRTRCLATHCPQTAPHLRCGASLTSLARSPLSICNSDGITLPHKIGQTLLRWVMRIHRRWYAVSNRWISDVQLCRGLLNKNGERTDGTGLCMHMYGIRRCIDTLGDNPIQTSIG